jgi:hypothetical protein
MESACVESSCIAALIIGLVLGAGGLYLYNYRKAKKAKKS